jgi:hypothetical protein
MVNHSLRCCRLHPWVAWLDCTVLEHAVSTSEHRYHTVAQYARHRTYRRATGPLRDAIQSPPAEGSSWAPPINTVDRQPPSRVGLGPVHIVRSNGRKTGTAGSRATHCAAGTARQCTAAARRGAALQLEHRRVLHRQLCVRVPGGTGTASLHTHGSYAQRSTGVSVGFSGGLALQRFGRL